MDDRADVDIAHLADGIAGFGQKGFATDSQAPVSGKRRNLCGCDLGRRVAWLYDFNTPDRGGCRSPGNWLVAPPHPGWIGRHALALLDQRGSRRIRNMAFPVGGSSGLLLGKHLSAYRVQKP